jgi:hypothetical protein
MVYLKKRDFGVQYKIEFLLQGPAGTIWAPNNSSFEADSLEQALLITKNSIPKVLGNLLEIIGVKIEPLTGDKKT